MHRIRRFLSALLAAVVLAWSSAAPALAAPNDVVTIPDSHFKLCVTNALALPAGSNVTEAQMAIITTLACAHSNVVSIEGAQYLRGVTFLELNNNPIDSLQPLAGLTSLERLLAEYLDNPSLTPLAGLSHLRQLMVANSGISNVSALSGMSSLRILNLDDNRLTSIAPLAGLTGLTQLSVNRNQLTSLAPIASMTRLTFVAANENQLTSVPVMPSLTHLARLEVSGNAISDLSSLDEQPSTIEVEAFDQQITFPDTVVGVPTLFNLRGISGAFHEPEPVAYATYNAGYMTYSRAGLYHFSFEVTRGQVAYFSGRISHTVTNRTPPQSPSVAPTEGVASSRDVIVTPAPTTTGRLPRTGADGGESLGALVLTGICAVLLLSSGFRYQKRANSARLRRCSLR